MEQKRITLKIDLQNGVIELDAPADEFDQAISKTMNLTNSLDFTRQKSEEEPKARPERNQPEPTATPSGAAPVGSSAKVSRSNSKPSAGRPGRIGTFEEAKGFLSESQERELRAFFAEKAPSEQGHRVLTAIVKGEQLLERKGFNYNEIYTLLRLGGIKPLPKALDVVLTRLMQDQFIVREGKGFGAKFLGREFVEDQLPPKAANGSK
jgi:hypothetical protein